MKQEPYAFTCTYGSERGDWRNPVSYCGHRLFSFVSINWRGKPLRDLVTIINLIKATKTDAGLKVGCVLDQNHYEKGKSVTDTDMQSLKLVRNSFHGERNSFHGEWNYTMPP
ncbi:MAG: hypothetical protein OXC63_11525 [Aestuariivita sp.]|nr:hypothetical protein [Aestuariivita sp.]MCY4346878.1 hypothetical protein [Aestuariivita sp.]